MCNFLHSDRWIPCVPFYFSCFSFPCCSLSLPLVRSSVTTPSIITANTFVCRTMNIGPYQLTTSNNNTITTTPIRLSAAFAPAPQQPTITSRVAAWKDDVAVGVTAPMGYFDPLGLSQGKSDEMMNMYREAELKHGRVAMAACLGWYLISLWWRSETWDSSCESGELI